MCRKILPCVFYIFESKLLQNYFRIRVIRGAEKGNSCLATSGVIIPQHSTLVLFHTTYHKLFPNPRRSTPKCLCGFKEFAPKRATNRRRCPPGLRSFRLCGLLQFYEVCRISASSYFPPFRMGFRCWDWTIQVVYYFELLVQIQLPFRFMHCKGDHPQIILFLELG